ncbi:MULTISPECIES: ribosomal protein L7/L12 [unclassified Sphingopyxis]|jgi:large subunit ribosomal protein L7/L12|uniref:ribosomal protein L7/L12 n=1 Tax=unclassified Sphingopyxis TaxID=2614943 RepID=UPI002866E9A7|nr:MULTISPECIES: ribosomal protein L7/L12 [unclassified Sphingopyxis]MDR6834136.1 uncharacterized protein YneF (UPF0154 family) [Sphingopyxis sp. BE122]MDR7226404.1 uncharacterized protein YneF (UPF0154 family) [Sphingopyxis sp. BE259]
MGKLLFLILGLLLGLLLARYLRRQRASRELSGPPPRPMVRVGDERINNDEIRALIRQNQKIEAIKRVRERTGLGLAEAKDAVEALEQTMR